MRDSLALLLRTVRIPTRSFADAASFLAALPLGSPACAVVDVRMPGMSGLELVETLRARRIAIPVVVMTGHADVPMAVRAMKAGAADFLEKPFNDQEMLEAVQRALAATPAGPRPETTGRYATLTPREREVMALIVEGKANKVVGAELGLSQRTVEVHRANVMDKMGARSLAELVRLALSLSGG